MQPATMITLTAAQRQQLTRWARAATTPQRLARRARARFVAAGCAGLQDRPRRGRPTVLAAATRALVVALACERPAEREVPLSRYSLSEIVAEVSHVLGSE